MSNWRVWALQAGRSEMDRSVATYLQGMGQSLVIPHTMFLLRGPSVVVVDTSFESVEAVKRAYPQEIWREPDEEPVSLLADLGVAPSDVATIVCTHLHYDHCGGNGLFPSARVLVQRAEVEYAQHPASPMMEREFFAASGGFTPPYSLEQMDLVDGDVDLGRGLRLLRLPGHTPGLQGLLVETSEGRLCLAGDQVMLSENFEANIPVGLHTDVDDWYRSNARLKTFTDWVVPSHDLRLFASGELIREVA